MRFFFDRNITARHVRMLAAYEGDKGCHARAYNDDARFGERTEDVEIIRTLHEEDPEWILAGGDGKILKRPAERAALAECDLTHVVFEPRWVGGDMHESAWMLIRVWPEIKRAVGRLGAHSVIRVRYKVQKVIDPDEIRATASYRG